MFVIFTVYEIITAAGHVNGSMIGLVARLCMFE